MHVVAIVFAVLLLPPAAATAAFSPPETISPPGVRTGPAQIAVDSRGNALAVWSTFPAPGPSVVQARSRSRKGVWGPLLTLSEPGESSGTPQVAFDAHDNAIVAWSSFELLPGDPYIGTARVRAAFRPAGGGFGASQVVRDEVGELQFGVQALAAHDDAVLGWTRFAAGDEIATLELAVRPGGGRFGAPVPMGRGDQPQVRFDRRNNAIVAWSRETGPESFPIYYSLKRAGSSFGPATLLWDGGPGLGALAVDRRGNTLVTTNDQDRRLVMFFRPAGGTFGPAQVVPGAMAAEAAFDDRGNARLVWATDFGRGCIMAMLRRPDGSLTAPQALTGALSEIRTVGLAAGKGAVGVWDRAEWTGPLTRATWRVEAAFAKKNGKEPFGAMEVVSDPSAEAFGPDVALDRKGNALVVWTRGDIFDYAKPRSVQFALGTR